MLEENGHAVMNCYDTNSSKSSFFCFKISEAVCQYAFIIVVNNAVQLVYKNRWHKNVLKYVVNQLEFHDMLCTLSHNTVTTALLHVASVTLMISDNTNSPKVHVADVTVMLTA